MDRISYLSDDIRDHILSSLPTEEATRATILSHQWRNVCATLPSYQFDQFEFQRKRETSTHEDFQEFVTQTLHLHNESDIEKLRIDIICEGNLSYSFINEWLAFVVSHNVRQLHLFLHDKYLPKVPVSIFSCKTLTELTLRNIRIEHPQTFEFPSLKILTLLLLIFLDENVTNQFFLNFSVLEDLSLKYCKFGNHKSFPISAPILKVLNLYSLQFEGQVHISSTVLRKIKYNDKVPLDIKLDTRVALYDASFTGAELHEKSMCENHVNHVVLPNTVNLSLMGYYLQLLVRKNDLLAQLECCSSSVKNLEVEMCASRNQFQVVTFLLRKYQDLETLRVRIESSFKYTWNFIDAEYQGKDKLSSINILTSLRIVEIEKFEGSDIELDLVSYLLLNASYMETMRIIFWKEIWDLDKAEKAIERMNIRKKIRSLPKASPSVQVQFF